MNTLAGEATQRVKGAVNRHELIEGRGVVIDTPARYYGAGLRLGRGEYGQQLIEHGSVGKCGGWFRYPHRGHSKPSAEAG